MILWPSKHSRLHDLAGPVILLAAVLATYFPAIYGGIHPVDDTGIVNFYSSAPSLNQILLPNNDSYYYRPLIELSFYLDNLFWGMQPSMLHLENILLHAGNCLLVYSLAVRLSDTDQQTSEPWLALLPAFWFALHPVQVEAVAWIAGRTDLLLAFFLLSASHCWVRWLEAPTWQRLTATMLFLTAALLTKETAFVFAAVMVLLAAAWPGSANARQRRGALAIMAAPALALLLMVVLFKQDASGFSRLLTASDLSPLSAAWELLGAVGFYLKKLIIPAPLNFAIVQVHPAYGLAGLLALPLLGWLWFVQRRAAALFGAALLLLLPPLLLVIKPIAWTPVAERYLYLPAAFAALGGLLLYHNTAMSRYRAPLLTVLLMVLVSHALLSHQRAVLWGDKLAFFQDAISKSPEFGSLYNELGGILLRRHNYDEALAAFEHADRLNRRDSMQLTFKANIMLTRLAQGDYAGARSFFFLLFARKQDAPADFLELLYKTDSKRLTKLVGVQRQNLAQDLLETLDLLHQKRPDPFWHYRSGQLALAVGERGKAAKLFMFAYTTAPDDAHYKGAAKTYLKKLGAIP